MDAIHEGTKVKVYQKPYADLNFEGEAVVCSEHKHLETQHEAIGYRWYMVRFEGERTQYARILHPRNVVVQSEA